MAVKVVPQLSESKEPAQISLENYIAVGCLLHADTSPTNPTPPSTPGSWTEVLPSKSAAPASQSRADLQKLINARWVRAFSQRDVTRVYLLAFDVARSAVPRESKQLSKLLQSLLGSLDASSKAWEGFFLPASAIPFDRWATSVEDSLFYIFNTLPSPQPCPSLVSEKYSRRAVDCLSDPKSLIRGLRTMLYPYQRRAAAMMVQRESAPQMQLDPRFEARTAPDGSTYYFSPRSLSFLRNPRYYDSVTGGILAETMGLGKTLICIATILSTKGHMPLIPPHYEAPCTPNRPQTASLMDMAASATNRHLIPWRGYLYDVQETQGYEMTRCLSALQQNPPKYEIPPLMVRTNRYTEHFRKADEKLLSSGTIIVVPRNLTYQWFSELEKHVLDGALKIMMLDTSKALLPKAEELIQYDVILFSRPRFEMEYRMGDDLYVSPLRAIHWLRIIIDEGHSFASTGTTAVATAEKLVTADRRWIVSGTPAKDLLGVEVELGAVDDEAAENDHKAYRQDSLQRRKAYDYHQEQKSGAIKSLGQLASHFLKVQPWASLGHYSLQAMDQAASWDDHVYRHEDYRIKTYSGFSACLRRTLESLVVKTQPDDVERDLVLPPLTHQTVRLQPCLYDKLTANLFVLLFTVNGITSERKDQDYLFHRNSIHHLHRLITNLHRSSFSWTGFKDVDVMKSLEVAQSYLEKTDTLCTPQDRQLMQDTMQMARKALDICGWNHLSQMQELGVFVRDWPAASRVSWAYPGCVEPTMMMGLTQAVVAQKHLNKRLDQDDPLQGFDEAGKSALLVARAKVQEENVDEDPSGVPTSPSGMVKSGVPSAGISQNMMGSKRLSVSGAAMPTPKKRSRGLVEPPTSESSPAGGGTANTTDLGVEGSTPSSPRTPRRGRKRRLSLADSYIGLGSNSTVGKAQVVGTTSSKLSYLVSQVLALHQEEKILIFFDADYIAYYLSQALDLFHIKHLIYANSLSGEQRAKYVVLFDTDPAQRVLVMDIRQAAHGLNLSSASRVFFVNPAYRPDVEAQAIKRAHRIGQTRPVRVETLVLAGTVEEAVYDRASRMTQGEHLAAKSLEDDEGIRGIIQSARVLPVAEREMFGEDQMARLAVAEQIFGRRGRRTSHQQSGLEMELFGDGLVDEQPKRVKKARSGPGPLQDAAEGHATTVRLGGSTSASAVGGGKWGGEVPSIFGPG